MSQLFQSSAIRFLIVGMLNTGASIVVAWMLSVWFAIDVRIAAYVGYAAGMIVSFLLNRRFTFGATDSSPLSWQLITFAMLNFVAATVYAMAVFWLKSHMPMMLALSVAAMASLGINYVGQRFIVFKR